MGSKYHNNKVKRDGYTFDSQKEYERYLYLKQLQRQGVISSLTVHKKFQLTPTIYVDREGRKVSKWVKDKKLWEKESSYYCDFFYYDKDGRPVVEDVKGFKTDLYKLKKKIMADKHGILIKEI